MPVYTAEPSGSERAAAATLLEAVAGGVASAADLPDSVVDEPARTGTHRVPAPRLPAPGERISA